MDIREHDRILTLLYSIPKYKLPTKGTEAQAAYQLIHDQLSLDGNPLLNLASFVHTWMPKEADQLMIENMSKKCVAGLALPYFSNHLLTASA
jgi:glutamate/tyrosine decarboxylase-like PLP-dependent enzyme